MSAQDCRVRIFLPASLADLADPDGLSPRAAHAVTDDLARALPGEDAEGLAFVALLAAADDCVALRAERGAGDGSLPRRVVVAAELRSRASRSTRPEALPSEVEQPERVPWASVVSLHVDDEQAEPDVAAAIAGDADALERAAERDLLWFDISELDALRALASSAG